MELNGTLISQSEPPHAFAEPALGTRVLPVNPLNVGTVVSKRHSEYPLDDWEIQWQDEHNPDVASIRAAADELRHGDVPVAFPTETVYGLGADATRSEAVRGIYRAKRRPADNPLIVHVCSLRQLRELLRPRSTQRSQAGEKEDQDVGDQADDSDPIPPIYHPLIRTFWPGPLTILLPLPSPSPLAPEVSGSQRTFGARLPASLLALLLIRAAGVPIAAPSANASGRPSPTAAEHVLDDLHGRISTILDAGPCAVGVESTVVDGLSDPPAVLRPGGVSLERIREVPGWERTVKAYRDAADGGANEAPRAPGMKYRHYAPRARVVLFETGRSAPSREDVVQMDGGKGRIGVIRTKAWPFGLGWNGAELETTNGEVAAQNGSTNGKSNGIGSSSHPTGNVPPFADRIHSYDLHRPPPPARRIGFSNPGFVPSTLPEEFWEVSLGHDAGDIARGLFAALRELDRRGVDVIFVEGIDDGEGDVAAAVMNRLRKAAEVELVR